ncbi:hypothetical protein DFJ73DRAFT_622269 [Zopfochytrium polystomum]|nr:hypothetical protein DFJ73DRAFT_622269 [Zopfochytrium polystomum]
MALLAWLACTPSGRAFWFRRVAARKARGLRSLPLLLLQQQDTSSSAGADVAAPVPAEGGNDSAESGRPTVVAFFHPFCEAGGGGERVLWTAIEGLVRADADTHVVVYAADRIVSAGPAVTPKDALLAKVKDQFNIALDPSRLSLVFLKSWRWLEAKRYPRLTLIAQSLGSLVTGWEAINLLIPDVFVDTIGFAFIYPLVKLVFGVTVVAYVHYPTISSDMLGVVREGTVSFNNKGSVSSGPLRLLKLGYYRWFSSLYSSVGSCADTVMASAANSTWTFNHLNDIWKVPERTKIVYPPCDTRALVGFEASLRERTILSVAQFRPEKAHSLQLEAMHLLLEQHPEFRDGPLKVYLILIGGCRNADDQKIVDDLRKQAKQLDLENNVRFIVNAPYADLVSHLSRSSVGLHTMTNEHFGIGVVEYMAAGLIPVAHDSGGPKMDIVVAADDGEPTGYRASTAAEFASCLHAAFDLNPATSAAMRERARRHVAGRFSGDAFQRGFVAAVRTAAATAAAEAVAAPGQPSRRKKED